MRFFKRIRRRLFISLATVAIFAIIAFFLFERTNSQLENKTQQMLHQELVDIGQVLVDTFDQRIMHAINEIELSGLEKTEGCLPQSDRKTF